MSDLPIVRLRPLTPADVPVLEAETGPEADPFNWAGYVDAGGLDNLIAERHTLRNDGSTLAVVNAEDLLLGTVSWHQVRTGPSLHSWCWNIGITLLSAQRGQGYGAAAQRVLAAYLFAQSPTARVEAETDSTNRAEQRALEKAGFTREGIRRQAQWRDGGWHDMVLYAVVRGAL